MKLVYWKVYWVSIYEWPALNLQRFFRYFPCDWNCPIWLSRWRKINHMKNRKDNWTIKQIIKKTAFKLESQTSKKCKKLDIFTKSLNWCFIEFYWNLTQKYNYEKRKRKLFYAFHKKLYVIVNNRGVIKYLTEYPNIYKILRRALFLRHAHQYRNLISVHN